MRLHRSFRSLPLLLLWACAGSDAGDAAPPAATAPDSPATATAPPAPTGPAGRELGDYRLTIADLEKWVAATSNIRRAARENPDLAAVLQALPQPRTLADMVAAYEGLPPTRQAIEKAGLSVREFAAIGFAYAQAALAAGAVESGASRDSVSAALRVHRDNLEFVLEHQSEIARVLQPLEAGG